MKPQIIRSIVFFALAVSFGTASWAQDFSASLSRSKVGAGERFRITYSVRNRNIEKLTLPPLNDFSLVGGPYQSNATQIINGNYSSTATVAYDFVCTKPGKYSIPGAVLKSGGQSFTSNALTLEVSKEPVAGGNTQAQSRQDPTQAFGGQPQQPTQDVKITGKDLFIVTSLSKSSVYPGEAVTVTYKIYTRFQQVSFEDIKFPEYPDAWMLELRGSGDKAFSRETYDGQVYNVATLQQMLFVPQRAGNFDIKPVTASVIVQFMQRSGNFWEDFFNGARVRQERKEVTGNPVVLRVKEFPEAGKPTDFNGATGNFTMAVKTDKNAVPVNDALTLSVTISGEGNLSLFDAPKPVFPSSFEAYDPKASEKVTAKAGGTSGSKTFDYLLIPRAPGEYVLEPVKFSFFDPKTGRYNTLVSDSIAVKVTGDATGGAVVGASGTQLENLADDIRYIKKEFDASDALSGYFPGFGFIGLFGVLLLATVTLWFARTKIWDLRNDTDRKKIRVADSVAVKRLKKAEEFLRKGNKSEFYEACYRAVVQYLQDRKGIELTSVSVEKLQAALLQQGVSEELASEAGNIIGVCELARFAPPGTASELTDFHHRCIRFISNMEKKK